RISDFVLPHQLARLILTEQLYRVFTIINHENYHH
ncbi:MAG: putative methyltransferase, partial [Bacteroidota bacterium]